MSATTKNYIGYEALVSYLNERKNWSYRGFLILHQDIIVTSLISLTNNSPLTLAKWKNIDVAWYNRFLDEAKELLEPNTFITVKKKINAEHLQQIKNLQIFWEEIIKKYEKENLVPAAITPATSLSKETLNQQKEDLIPAITTVISLPKENLNQQEGNLIPTITTVTSFSKETLNQQKVTNTISLPKDIVNQNQLPDNVISKETNNNIKLINFCYDILYKLENNPYAHLFYKYNEKDIINKVIKYPMDLCTINLKLENNQYTNLEEFEEDIRLIFRNCYTCNDIKSEIYCSGVALESIFNKKWNEKLIFQTRKKGELKRARDNDADINNSLISKKKQNQVLEENKNNVIYKQDINNTYPVTSAYENLVMGNIISFIEILKAFLSTRSRMSLSSADESMLQVIVESFLPLKYRIPELSLVMDGKKPKGSGRFGYLDIFVLKGIGDNYIGLELKYISLVGLIKNQNTKYGANELENLDKVLEKEDEEFLLKRPYTYWSKEHKKTNQTTIGEVLNNGIDQLKSYINIISKGKPINYSSSGVFDERIKITKSESNILKGYVILVIGFRRILWRPVENVISNYTYNKI
ncbi:hypothetical protein RclHR1_02790005 [Rhizophagus clarus]|uniref:Bromo domain-containing protein n=1 Tax=Rhizophagus clarus TaxID=94130 RepID=A0A2Z6R6U5_9GLOM|nr:hypothetical protein RclHR1_02790005 [Rhizophagus clarus]